MQCQTAPMNGVVSYAQPVVFQEDLNDPKYKCCCCCHVKRGCIILGVYDLVRLVLWFLSMVIMFARIGPPFTKIFVMEFIFGFMCLMIIIIFVVGLVKENPFLILPQVIVEGLATLCYLVIVCIMIGVVATEGQMGVDILIYTAEIVFPDLKQVPQFRTTINEIREYKVAKVAARVYCVTVGGVILVFVAIQLMFQIYFFRCFVRCFQYFKAKTEQQKSGGQHFQMQGRML